MAAAAQTSPLEDMRRQIEASQFEQAWATAQANPQLIGDVHFDFFYGIAAINTGRVSEGLLALERHLAAVPANDRARLELARGYFLLGEFTRARKEFEFVLGFNPPASVQANIQGFLQAMQTREGADRRAAARLYVEAGGGYDNNVNVGTFRDSINLPLGNVQLLAGSSRQVADGFAQVALGGQQLLAVTPRLSVFAGADLDHKENAEEKAFNLSNLTLNAGFTQLSGIALWRATLGYNVLLVGGNRYRDTRQLGVDASFSLGPDLTAQAFVQLAELRHPQADEFRDARLVTVGGAITRSFSGWPWAPSAGVRVSWSKEDNQQLRRDLSREIPLVRLYAAVSPLDRLRLALGLTWFAQDFAAPDLAFASERRDDSVALDFSANWTFDARWSARLEGSWSRNRSNQDLYDYGRKNASLKLRYQY